MATVMQKIKDIEDEVIFSSTQSTKHLLQFWRTLDCLVTLFASLELGVQFEKQRSLEYVYLFVSDFGYKQFKLPLRIRLVVLKFYLGSWVCLVAQKPEGNDLSLTSHPFILFRYGFHLIKVPAIR